MFDYDEQDDFFEYYEAEEDDAMSDDGQGPSEEDERLMRCVMVFVVACVLFMCVIMGIFML